MSLAKDLMQVGIPDQAAKRIGFQTGTLTATGSAASDAAVASELATLVLVDSTGASQGIILPSTAELGVPYVYGNISANALLIYPPTLGQINGDTASTGTVPLTARGTTILIRVDTINWIAIGGAAG